MARLSYPALAFDNLTAAIDIVRAGQIVAKRDLFANLVWNIQGPLQSLVFGNPDKPTVVEILAEEADRQANIEDRLEEFGSLLLCAQKQYEVASATAATDADPKAIDPATILAIVNIVLQLIDTWRKRKQNQQA
jgi:hypothetical protein